ncbi:MAG: hydroxysqualene dehydroxylase HpnE [Rhodocyclaceae bacterium]|nr:hydroxysqualene dehydroxylase HpnE [Rhodocyclaceae bacterium]
MADHRDMARCLDKRVAVVGGGYAGLAAAVELVANGIKVDVFEASRTLGGRARSIEIAGMTVDNGSHILLGAYRETLRLMRQVGAPETSLQRHPLHIEIPNELRLIAPRLPSPFHLGWALLAAQGLSWTEKFAAMRFMRHQHHFHLDTDITVSTLLAEQPEKLRRTLWEPLCLAALNTPVATASAQIFLNVLRDSLAADRADSDLLLPAQPLSALFPEPAARFIEARGGRVFAGTRIASLTQHEGKFRLDDESIYDQVILAVAPQHLSKLILGLPELAPVVKQVEKFEWKSIVTCYLSYPETVCLPFPMVASGNVWFFDLGTMRGHHGLMAAVLSCPETRPDSAYFSSKLTRIIPNLPLHRWHRVITEKRATFACTPNLSRPTTQTALPGLWLAGDYVAGDYPATLEGAVRSGVAAARLIIK